MVFYQKITKGVNILLLLKFSISNHDKHTSPNINCTYFKVIFARPIGATDTDYLIEDF